MKCVSCWLAFAMILGLSSSTAQAIWPWTTTSKSSVSRPIGSPLNSGRPLVTTVGTSTWDKVSSGTKRVVNTTVDVVTLKPFRDKWNEPAAKPSQPWTPPPMAVKKKQETSWFGSWFKPAEPKKMSTVSDWMAQPRPEF